MVDAESADDENEIETETANVEDGKNESTIGKNFDFIIIKYKEADELIFKVFQSTIISF